MKPEMKLKRYAMVVDLDRCIGCSACAVACKMENDVPLGVWRIWVNQIEQGIYPKVQRFYLPMLCNHCENPICVYPCPVKATFRRKQDGIVVVDSHLCVGCKICIVACPYQMRYLDPIKRVAQKCNFCIQRIGAGLEPACVEACPTEALIFGDLKDMESPVTKRLIKKNSHRLKTSYGTKPQIYYMGQRVHLQPFEKGGSIYDLKGRIR